MTQLLLATCCPSAHPPSFARTLKRRHACTSALYSSHASTHHVHNGKHTPCTQCMVGEGHALRPQVAHHVRELQSCSVVSFFIFFVRGWGEWAVGAFARLRAGVASAAAAELFTATSGDASAPATSSSHPCSCCTMASIATRTPPLPTPPPAAAQMRSEGRWF